MTDPSCLPVWVLGSTCMQAGHTLTPGIQRSRRVEETRRPCYKPPSCYCLAQWTATICSSQHSSWWWWWWWNISLLCITAHGVRKQFNK